MCVPTHRKWLDLTPTEITSSMELMSNVQKRQQSSEPVSNCQAAHPQKQFIHRESPQVEGLRQCDLEMPPHRLSLTPLVPGHGTYAAAGHVNEGRGGGSGL